MICNSGSTNSCAALAASINDVERNSIAVFPNPAVDVLNFTLNEPASIEVIDATGRTVMERVVNYAGKVALDLNELPTGVYTLRTIGSTIGTSNFIKK